jgi:hypothetical protein
MFFMRNYVRLLLSVTLLFLGALMMGILSSETLAQGDGRCDPNMPADPDCKPDDGQGDHLVVMGKVIDNEGKTVDRADVDMWPNTTEEDAKRFHFHQTTNISGEFRIGIPVDVKYRSFLIMAKPPVGSLHGMSDKIEVTFVATETKKMVDLKLGLRQVSEGTTIFGRVVDVDGKPVEGVGVAVGKTQSPQRQEQPDGDGPKYWVKTNQEGKFQIDGLPNDLAGHSVFFFPPPDMWQWEIMPVSLDGKSGDIGEFKLQKKQTSTDNFPKSVKGKVVDGDGKAVKIKVYARQETGGRHLYVMTADNGEFMFKMSGGTWILGVDAPPNSGYYFDHEFGEVRVKFEDNDTAEEWPEAVMLKVKKVAGATGDFYKVTGKVTTADNKAVPSGVEIHLCNDEGRCFRGEAGADGSFTANVLVGTYKAFVKIQPESGYMPPDPADIQTVKVIDHDVALEKPIVLRVVSTERTANIKGQVVITPTMQGLEGALVEVWSMRDVNKTETNSTGAYSMTLVPGEWGARVVLTGTQRSNYVLLPPHSRHGKVESGKTVTATFYVQRFDATISGTVYAGTTPLAADQEAVVIAELCQAKQEPPRQNQEEEQLRECYVVGKADVQSGHYEMNLLGGHAYRLSVKAVNYIPQKPEKVDVPVGGLTKDFTVQEPDAVITGRFVISGTNRQKEDIKIDARVFARDPNGNWVEDVLLSQEDITSATYKLKVTKGTSWTIGYDVNPEFGYVPVKRAIEILVDEATKTVNLPVKKLGGTNAEITGTVMISGGTPLAKVLVIAEPATVEQGPQGPVQPTQANDNPNQEQHHHVFKAETNDNGMFRISVAAGKDYRVSAYVPADMQDKFGRPEPKKWSSPADNPVKLILLPRPQNDGVRPIIEGAIKDSSNSIGGDMPIDVHCKSDKGDRRHITGTVNVGYKETVMMGTWACRGTYQDEENNKFYISEPVTKTIATTGTTQMPPLELKEGTHKLPDQRCQEFNTAEETKFELPGRDDLLPPSIEIPADAIPADGMVKICAKPSVSLPDGENFIGFGYEMTLFDSEGNEITENFNKKVLLIFHFDANVLASLPAGENGEILLSYYSTILQDWVSLDDQLIDEDKGIIAGSIDHFTDIGAQYVPEVTVTAGSGTTPADVYLPVVVK